MSRRHGSKSRVNGSCIANKDHLREAMTEETLTIERRKKHMRRKREKPRIRKRRQKNDKKKTEEEDVKRAREAETKKPPTAVQPQKSQNSEEPQRKKDKPEEWEYANRRDPGLKKEPLTYRAVNWQPERS